LIFDFRFLIFLRKYKNILLKTSLLNNKSQKHWKIKIFPYLCSGNVTQKMASKATFCETIRIYQFNNNFE